MDARQIIDYAAEDNAKDFREALYASIYDKVNSHIETMKQSVAHGLVTAQEESVTEAKDCECEDEKEKEDHEDEKEDKALVKKMVKKDSLKSEEVQEELKGKQHKIDKNKNGKIDAQDFKLLRKEEVEEIEEAVTRKHFQMVADLIKSHEDPAKRKELAQHHSEIFKQQNPRFDHAKFMKAAGASE